MSEGTDCKQSTDSASRKRCQSSDKDEIETVPHKSTKVTDTSKEIPSEGCRNNEAESKVTCNDMVADVGEKVALENSTPAKNSNTGVEDPSHSGKPQSPRELTQAVAAEETPGRDRTSASPLHQSDSAAIAAAEALASLTGGNGKAGASEKMKHQSGKLKQRPGTMSSKGGSKTQAALADSSTSLHSTDGEDEDDVPDEGDQSLQESLSTSSSSFPSDDENDDGECAIVSVKMAPEMRQSVAVLAQVQSKLEALEKKSARLHQRLEVKIGRLKQPHLDQRSTITKTIPGFWVTALLNHPHLSAHIDETDEDALSYMMDLEIEPVKNSKLGFRIRFHFRRNPYFQNNIIMKELHLGVGGPAISFSNPILWHRGHNLTAHSEPRKLSRGVYETFFSWFSDHSNPGQDDVAQILKDDLYRDPLRYYLTPQWEPRENGSTAGGARTANNGSGDDCVVISDSDEDPGEEEQKPEEDRSQEDVEDDDDDEEEEEEEEEEDEEGEEERGRSADESQEEDVVDENEEDSGEIVIDGSDDSEQEEKHQHEDEEKQEEDEDTEN